jgi:hypothetical protein
MHGYLILALAALTEGACDSFLALVGTLLNPPSQSIFLADGKLRITIRFGRNCLFKFTFGYVPISLEF